MSVTDAQQQGQRLKELIKHYRISQLALSQMLSVTAGYVSVLISGKEEISRVVLNKLAASFEMLNLDWFIRGRGDMLFEQNRFVSQVEEPSSVYHKSESPLEQLQREYQLLKERLEALEQRLMDLEKK